MRDMLERVVYFLLRVLPLRWRSITVIPVLHVERLYDDRAFEAVIEFCVDYTRLTGRRALATVITPIAPLLASELKVAGFHPRDYASRLAALANVADIGLHGHFLRGQTESQGPIHNYWPEKRVVEEQIEEELAWLREQGLLPAHGLSYAAGWWYLDHGVRAALEKRGFDYDFTRSRNRYNISMRVMHDGGADVERPREFWAVASLGAAGTVSRVPRHIFAGHWRALIRGLPTLLSLYSHDWDMPPARARTTLQDLARLRVGFADLASMSRS